MIYADISLLWAEVVLALGAMGLLILCVYTGKDAYARALTYGVAAFMALLAVGLILGKATNATAFENLVIVDGFARFTKVVILFAGAAVLVMGCPYLERRGALRFEYPILVALSTVGMMIMVGANNLMTLYMGLELQSLALYVLASLRRDSALATEAGMKYFVLGALSSGILLYGMSLVYGYTGSMQFDTIMQMTSSGETSVVLLIGLVLMISGLAFKVSAVPFHMWTPDVYQGAPTPITAFFATAPKVAALALFARVMHGAFAHAVHDWQQVITLISILSMFLGSIAAIGQDNIKRLMAYSSIAHMGYALIGLAAGTDQGVSAMLIYMVIYVTMNIGTFAFILSMERDGRPVTSIADLGQYGVYSPMRAYALLILLFSLAGVPPMLGFFAKFAVWNAAISAGLVPLVVASAIASAIGAYYYLRIVYLMFFGTAPAEALRTDAQPVLQTFLYVPALLMIVGVISIFGIDSAAQDVAKSFVNAAH